MGKFTCEMCGNNNLVKRDGMYVCEFCGTKYTPEEAKKLITVKVDNSDMINNYLELSNNAYNGGNGRSALEYANKALEIGPKNSQAWIAKARALQKTQTFDSVNFNEYLNVIETAIKCASENDKKYISAEVYKFTLEYVLDTIKHACKIINATDDIKNTYVELCQIDFNDAPRNASIADVYINTIDNAANEAFALCLFVPDEVYTENPKLLKIAKNCLKQYEIETRALNRRFKIYRCSLSDEAMSIRNARVNAVKDKILELDPTAFEKEEINAREKEKQSIMNKLGKAMIDTNETAKFNIGYYLYDECGVFGDRLSDLMVNEFTILKEDELDSFYDLASDSIDGLLKDDVYSKKLKDFLSKPYPYSSNESQQNQPQNKSGGCYVATAIYGSYDCPQVWTLRRYRDYRLDSTWYGKLFIMLYYAISPTLVKWFGETKWFKKMWKGKLDRMVERLQAEGYENTPYNDKY